MEEDIDEREINQIERLEFDHFIAEFEAVRDTMLDQISSLRHELEIMQNKLDDIKENYVPDTPSQSKLL